MTGLAVLAQTVSVVAILVGLWLSRMRAPVWSALHTYLLLSAIVLVAWRTIDLIRGRLSLVAYRQAKAHWPQLAAALLRVVVWVLMAVAVDVAMPTETFRYQAESRTKSWIAASVLVILALLPRQRRWAPGDVLFGVLLLVVGVDLARAINEHADNALDVTSPLERTSYVLNGGASLLVNEHVRLSGGAWGTDLYPFTRSGRLCQGSGLTEFPCFGAPVLAPVAGRIGRVVSDRPDMPLGTLDEEVPTGNSVSIQTHDGRCLVLAHLKQSTILVSEGEDVQSGSRSRAVATPARHASRISSSRLKAARLHRAKTPRPARSLCGSCRRCASAIGASRTTHSSYAATMSSTGSTTTKTARPTLALAMQALAMQGNELGDTNDED